MGTDVEITGIKTNLALPGNPRYQPGSMKPYFGYDNLYGFIGEVEFAALQEIVVILEELRLAEPGLSELVNEDIHHVLSGMVTSEVDAHERAVTKHDIRAFVQLAQNHLPVKLRKYLHALLTSYDPIDSATALRFKRAYEETTKPAIIKLLESLCDLAALYKGQVQIGRTHGQHALPITIGFWLATAINRIVYNWLKLDAANQELTGKISGAVGAYNAYVGLGLDTYVSAEEFEQRVLARLGLKPAAISTQIAPPEPLAYFLFSATMLSAAIAQFANDCRHLMRSEIGEIQEEFIVGQVGSSTMAHKRNPIVFENTVGGFKKNKAEFYKVLDTLISEHQRDLTDSSVMRDFPVILINLQTQLDNLNRENKDGVPFIKRVTVNKENLEKNLSLNADVLMAEAIYIALQLYGYQGDAHKLVNETLVPLARLKGYSLAEALTVYATNGNDDVRDVLAEMPEEINEMFFRPEKYTGLAELKTIQIVTSARDILARMQ